MHTIKSSLIALVCAAATATAVAEPVIPASVKVSFDNPIFNGSGFDAVSISFPRLSGATTTVGVKAGRFQGTASEWVNITPDRFVDDAANLFTYCYDLYETINHGQRVNYTIDFTGAQARTLDFLGAVNSVMSVDQNNIDPYAWLHPVNGNQSAAIQIGIWESLYDSTGWNLGTGAFTATGLNLTSTALLGTGEYWSLFAGAIASTEALDERYTMVLRAAGAQDMITGDRLRHVPEPGSLALVGLALASLVANGRSRRKRAHG